VKYFVDVDGQPMVVNAEAGRVEIGDESVAVELVQATAAPVYLLAIDGVVHSVVATRGSAQGEYTIWTDEHRLEVEVLDERSHAIRDATATSGTQKGPARLLAPMPGLIVRVTVQVGDSVEAGQSLVVMEAMKMENELRAATPGTVKSIPVEVGTAVEKGVVLVEME
jgi:biotin carboxyl carrier protein